VRAGGDEVTKKKPAGKYKHPGPKIKRDDLRALLERHGGSVAAAAAEVGMPQKSVYRRLHAEGMFEQLGDMRRAADARAEAEELARARAEFRAALSAGDVRRMLRATLAIVDVLDDAEGWDEMTAEQRGDYIARRMAEMAGKGEG
jgi:hypothetical protein